MKKKELLNQELSGVIAGIGHGDLLTIVDCGFPIPAGSKKIDLALKRGVPSFIDTLDAILDELAVEKVIIAEEVLSDNQPLYEKLISRFPKEQFEIISHTEFKRRSSEAKAIVRTGENTSYSNIMLVAGVLF